MVQIKEKKRKEKKKDQYGPINLEFFVQTLKQFIRDLLIYNCLLIASNSTGTYEYHNIN